MQVLSVFPDDLPPLRHSGRSAGFIFLAKKPDHTLYIA